VIRRLFAIYLCLLAVSQFVRTTAPAINRPIGKAQIVLPAIDQNRRTERTVGLAYSEYRSTDAGDGVVMLIHGSPGDSRVFERLGTTLSRHHRVFTPDLPGFGASSLEVPDYSLGAHAKYVINLLDHLRIARVHVVGFSMGGGVALNVADLGKDRIASLVLLSGIGVQEMELLGNYHANHAVHGVQLGALWLIRMGVPDFGLLNRPLSVTYSYARNFYDSDQRPIRKILSRLEIPTLILHGREDAFVPVEAAYEHARLVPQSELHLLNQGHFMLFTETPDLARLIGSFLQRVDNGDGIRRLQAPSHRVKASKASFDTRLIPRARAVTAVVLGVAIAATTVINPHVGSVGAGVLQGQGRSSLWLALVGSLVGSSAGDWLRWSRRSGPSLAARFSRNLVQALAIVTGSALVAPTILHATLLTGLDSWSCWGVVTAVLSASFWLLGIALRSVPAWASSQRASGLTGRDS
jgi:pimeloyl-ACP methyl ester carboxylesterase